MILIMEDDDTLREFMRMILERGGYRVVEAADGVRGLEQCSLQAPDLIMVDIHMPRMDGLEAIQKVRESGLDCPILALSGGGRDGHMDFLDHACRFGADDFLRKPLLPETLLNKVHNLLDESASPAA